jgi:protein-S-isoprenylcysteine O-methyltransferase Ste14
MMAVWLEHRIPPPVIGLLAGAAMWGIDQVVPSLRYPFAGQQLLALAIGAVGLALDVAGLVEFRRQRTTINPLRPQKASALVRSGIFRLTRNPMYLGMATVLAGWGVYLANPLSLIAIPAYIAYLNRFQIAPEERALESRFGADFARYRAEVRRWL